MNILYISNTSEMYGANTSLIDIIDEIINRNHKAFVIVMKNSMIIKELKKRNVNYYALDYGQNCSGNVSLMLKINNLIHNLKVLPQLKKIIKKNKIDIIHSNASNIDIGAIASIIYKVPHIWHIRELLYEHYNLKYDFLWLENFLQRKSERLIAISEYVKEKRKLGNNSVVLYNGFNLNAYVLNKKQYFNDDTIKILYCGVISHEKGIMDIIKAIRYLIKGDCKKIELFIAGGKSGYCGKVMNYVKKHDLSKYIHYCGYQNELKTLREKSHIAVMTSRYEALGRVTIESMLGELLVIGANSGGTSEIIKNGETGILYEPGNYKELANIIKGIIDVKDMYVNIIHNAKKYAQQEFDSKRYVDKLLQIYEKIV